MEDLTKISTLESEPSEMVKKVLSIGEQAAAILMKHHNKIIDVEFKKDEYDPVTEADKESDEFIRNEIKRAFPNDLILSEENTEIPKDYNVRVWMIDPLDGTKDFLKGYDNFSINIGLLEGGCPVFGCCVIPVRSQYLFAEKGKGAFQKKGDQFEKLSVSSCEDIESTRVIIRKPTLEVRPIEEVIKKIPHKETVVGGSVGDKVYLMTTNQAEYHVNSNFKASKWDNGKSSLVSEVAYPNICP